MAFYRNDGGPIHVPPQYDLLKGRSLFILVENRQHLLFISREIARQQTQGIFGIVGVFGHEKQIERRTAVHHQLSLAIKNHAARSRNSLDADAIVLRQKGITLALDYLQKQ